ncbi:MAG: hypothetical protein JSU83_06040 [Deltaproteobacteria bacterium]|nr:MAG: hypothetical protein JSU83_06040 [Deltaproteobacteria bacterium]
MMRKLVAYLFLFFLFLLIPQFIHSADLQEGFSGIKWGTDIYHLTNFKKIGSSGTVSYYLNPEKIHTIYEIDVPHVVYGFYNDQLFAVFAALEKFEVYSKLKSELTAKFGNPETTLTSRYEQTIYKWKDKNIKIKLKLRGVDDKMKLAFYYTPLSNEVNESRVEEFPEKSYRFFPIEKNKKWERIPLLEF